MRRRNERAIPSGEGKNKGTLRRQRPGSCELAPPCPLTRSCTAAVPQVQGTAPTHHTCQSDALAVVENGYALMEDSIALALDADLPGTRPRPRHSSRTSTRTRRLAASRSSPHRPATVTEAGRRGNAYPRSPGAGSMDPAPSLLPVYCPVRPPAGGPGYPTAPRAVLLVHQLTRMSPALVAPTPAFPQPVSVVPGRRFGLNPVVPEVRGVCRGPAVPESRRDRARDLADDAGRYRGPRCPTRVRDAARSSVPSFGEAWGPRRSVDARSRELPQPPTRKPFRADHRLPDPSAPIRFSDACAPNPVVA